MSVNHKRPLYAFVVVAIMCALIIANALRSEAVMGVLEAGAARVVAGAELTPRQPSEAPVLAREPVQPAPAPAAPTSPESAPASVAGSSPQQGTTVRTGHPSTSGSSHASAEAGAAHHSGPPSRGGHAPAPKRPGPRVRTVVPRAVHHVVHVLQATARTGAPSAPAVPWARHGREHGLGLPLGLGHGLGHVLVARSRPQHDGHVPGAHRWARAQGLGVGLLGHPDHPDHPDHPGHRDAPGHAHGHGHWHH